MAIQSDRRLPPRETPFLDADGFVSLDWYNYFRLHDDEHGGLGVDTLVRTPNAPTAVGGSGIGGAGTSQFIIDGVQRDVTFE